MYDEQSKLLGPRTDRRGAASRADLCRPGTAQPRSGSALELYYHLAEAEGKVDLLGRGEAELNSAMPKTRDMTAQKLKPPVALDIWTRQLLSMQSDQTQAEMTVNQLNVQLRQLLGLSDADNWRIWNPELYDVTESEVDVEAAVAEGLSTRPELQLLPAPAHSGTKCRFATGKARPASVGSSVVGGDETRHDPGEGHAQSPHQPGWPERG